MILLRIVPILVGIFLIVTPLAAERVFFSDGTIYNASMTKTDILTRFENATYSGPIIVFHDLICASCQDAMIYFVEFEQNYPEIDIEYYDLHGNTSIKLMFEDYMKTYHQKNLLAPTVFIGPAGIEGNESIKKVFEPFSLLYEENKK
jgi:hypothetical protein